jgi:hypothetical protein
MNNHGTTRRPQYIYKCILFWQTWRVCAYISYITAIFIVNYFIEPSSLSHRVVYWLCCRFVIDTKIGF